jgi:hypothetical protein
MKTARRLILARLVTQLTSLPRPALLKAEGPFVPVAMEVEDALDALIAEGLVAEGTNGISLANILENDEVRVKVLRELTDEEVFVSAICSPGWLKLIDDRLLNAISKIQGDLPIPPEYRAESLSLLRWSPAALAWSLRPDAMLIQHRIKPEERTASETNDVRYFRIQLLQCAVNDFINGPFARLHFERLDLRELEFLRRAKFKSSTKVELEVELTERLAIARTTPELGGGVAKIWVYDQTPEPWNWPKSHDTEAGSPSQGDESSGTPG